MSPYPKKRINLALQGGGAHGAFTWGVLDRLLEDDRIEFEGITGTSSGAMTAAVMAYGLISGGREHARALLSRLWEAIADMVPFEPPENSVLDLMQRPQDPNPWLQAYVDLARTFSPYFLNPTGYNPLRALLAELIDFERLRAGCPIKLFVGTTRVRSGKAEVFRNPQLSTEVLLASACVPSLHHSVEIEGEPYWDGGFSGNPPILPMILETRCKDIAVIMLHPMSRPGVPMTSKAIWERMTELAFHSTFLREMRIIGKLMTLATTSVFPFGNIERRFRKLRFHLIEEEELMAQLSHGSRFNVRRSFLTMLRNQGRAKAETWLAQTYSRIGVGSSIDFLERFA